MFKSHTKLVAGLIAALIGSSLLFASPASAREGNQFPTTTNCLNDVKDFKRADDRSTPGVVRVVLRYSKTCDTIYAEAVGAPGATVYVSAVSYAVTSRYPQVKTGTVNNYYPGSLSKGYSRMIEADGFSSAKACVTRPGKSDLCTKSEWFPND